MEEIKLFSRCYQLLGKKASKIIEENYGHIFNSTLFPDENMVKKIECTIPGLDKAIHRNMRGIVLKITEMCNMRCSYCPHAQPGNPHMNIHKNKHMAEKIAFAGIDYLCEHSSNTENVDIIFFGGEPLIRFDLIKKVVEYAEKRMADKYITFNITTNAIILNDAMINFFSKHKFCICISLDGPQKVHDMNRKNKGSKGTFCRVYMNYQKLKNAFKSSQSTVRINAVADGRNDLREIESFFFSESFENVFVDLSPVDYTGSISHAPLNSSFDWQILYVRFMIYLCILGKISYNDLPLIANSYFTKIKNIYDRLKNKKIMSNSGIYDIEYDYCSDGFIAYLNTEGNYFPGVYVNEKNEDLIIGNVIDGIDLSKIRQILEKCAKYRRICTCCKYLSYCNLPVSLCIDAKGELSRLRNVYCNSFFELWHETMDLLILEELLKKDCLDESNDVEIRKNNISNVLIDLLYQFNNKEYGAEDNLLSSENGISPIDLAYLLYRIEHEFNITFLSEDINRYNFCTVKNITDIIEKVLGRKAK